MSLVWVYLVIWLLSFGWRVVLVWVYVVCALVFWWPLRFEFVFVCRGRGGLTVVVFYVACGVG